MLFFSLFTLAHQNPEQAKDLMSLSGVTPFGVATNTISLATAYWVVSSRRDE